MSPPSMEKPNFDEIMEDPLQSSTQKLEAEAEMSQFERLAAFMNRDPTYLVFRRFGELNLRNLLLLQHEIGQLEQSLKSSAPKNGSNVDPGSRQAQQRLMTTVQDKLDRYNRALIAHSQLGNFGSPEANSVSDIRDWAMDNNCVQSISHLPTTTDSSDELLSLSVSNVKDEKDWVYRVIERRLWSRFARPVPDEGGGTLYIFPDKKIHHVVRAIFTFVTTTILLIPIIILFFLNKGYPSLIVIIVSTALFSVIVAITTRCKNQEIMLAAAAYAAVMVVFLGR